MVDMDSGLATASRPGMTMPEFDRIHHRIKKGPCFGWIAPSSSAKTRFALLPAKVESPNNHGNRRMRPNSAQLLIALVLAAPVLAGCLERGRPTVVDTSDDDAICRANNVAAGSSEYVACRRDRDVQRTNATARADRRQRDLGEYMLNHPDHP
jgi:hypothetical protein